jgi:hypothetical protein
MSEEPYCSETQLNQLIRWDAIFLNRYDEEFAVRGRRDEATLRLLHRHGQWLIDLRLDRDADERVFLVGQIFKSGQLPKTLRELTVLLLSGNRVVQQTAPNPFGEFQLNFRRDPGLRLHIGIPKRRSLEISLPDLWEVATPDQ